MQNIQMNDKIKTKVYAGRVKDKNILLRSSSGGAFSVLSDAFFVNDNIVVAAVYDYQTHTVPFRFIHNKEERNAACGSKYLQSRPENIFKKSEIWLKNNPDKKLLFVGMGCQAEGFRKFAEMKGIRDRVYIVDIICHGVPSPKIWREYAKTIEKKYGGKISFLTFKDKRNGWKAPTAFVLVRNQEVLINDYVKLFYNRCALRPACHVCPFATTERNTDITIGDFWHIEDTIPDFYDPEGNSVFLIHTKYGQELFNCIKEKLYYRESDVKQCWQANLEAPTPISIQRDKFWMDYRRKGIDFIMKKYGQESLKESVKKIIRKVICGFIN